jgi:hypothetical protein
MKIWKFNIDVWTLLVILAIVFIAIFFLFFRDKNEFTQFVGVSYEDIQLIFRKKKRIEKKNETECRKTIERLLHAPFPSVRPSFLKSPWTGRNLELDCYNPRLKLALEYNGEQHYNFLKFFHRHKEDFNKQVERDRWKMAKCKQLGITVIVVPYTVHYSQLRPYIYTELKKLGYIR